MRLVYYIVFQKDRILHLLTSKVDTNSFIAWQPEKNSESSNSRGVDRTDYALLRRLWHYYYRVTPTPVFLPQAGPGQGLQTKQLVLMWAKVWDILCLLPPHTWTSIVQVRIHVTNTTSLKSTSPRNKYPEYQTDSKMQASIWSQPLVGWW